MRGMLAPLLVAIMLAGVRPAHAQCADGSPPPCGPSTTSLSRRADPPLDARTWIVVPFDNLARTADIDWLRRASVNLLYLNLSQWKDVHVVDDDRVGELLGDVPGAGGTAAVPLATAMRVARRAGAGRLVMGDFLKTGSRTTVTAKVFDVRTGARVRSVTESALAADSILPTYARLARKVLDVPAVEAGEAAALGTARLDAYQEFIAGAQAFRRFDLVTARRRLERALALDSAFALAHYKLGQVIAWYDPGDSLSIRARAAAAQRFGSDLPAREKALIRAWAAEVRHQHGEACDIYSEMLRADSLDVDALFGLGTCSARDNALVTAAGDTSAVSFRSSWNTAIRSLTRVLELDPANHLAFDGIVDVLSSELRFGCRHRDGSDDCIPQSWRVAVVRRLGDTLLTVPAQDTLLRAHLAEAGRTNARRANLELARRLALSWTELAPNEPRARVTLANILLRMGRFDEAQRELARRDVAALRDPTMVRQVLYGRTQIAIKQWRWKDAALLVDSMLRADDPVLRRTAAARYAPAFGRLRGRDSLLALSDTLLAPVLRGQRRQVPRIILGMRTDSAALAEARLLISVTMASLHNGVPLAAFETFAFGLRLPRKQWPSFDEDRPEDARVNLVVALSRGDSAPVRDYAVQLDSAARALAAAGIPDSGSAVVAADAHLILGDSASALSSLRCFLDCNVATTPFMTPLTSPHGVIVMGEGPSPVGWLWPRAMLQRAELAHALGYKEEARLWYQRFIDAWAGADAEFQPIVERARQALGTL